MSNSPLALFCKKYRVQPSVFPPSAPPLRAERDDRYTIIGELGRGTFGRVATALDHDLRRYVAIKILDRNIYDPSDIQAFLNEAIIIGQLEHPNIIPVYELSYSNNLGLYYTMKRYSNQSLRSLLNKLLSGDSDIIDRYSQFRRITIVTEIGRALAHAHERHIVHSDLKPEHVLLGQLGGVVVADWGLAQVLNTNGCTPPNNPRPHDGTPLYMSPEQITETAADLDERTDVWSLGAVLYELLTLHPPFPAHSPEDVYEAILTDKLILPSVRAQQVTISPRLDEICQKALSKSRNHRYQKVADLLADIYGYQDGTRTKIRRHEHLQRVLRESERILTHLHTTEVYLQTTLAEPAAEATRDHLLTGYEQIGELIHNGLNTNPRDPHLMKMAGQLYWRIFTNIYPSGPRSHPDLTHRALDLMVSLTSRATTAVVNEGRRRAPEHDPTTEDPWLDIIQALSRNEAIAIEKSPDELQDIVTRIELLRKVGLFRTLASYELLPIAEACEELRLRAGQHLFQEGDQSTHLYVVQSGTVKILHTRGSILSEVHSGGVFGEVSVLGATLRGATAQAATHSVCLALDAAKFYSLLRGYPDISVMVIEALASRLDNALTANIQDNHN